jgi:hypothetical protein
MVLLKEKQDGSRENMRSYKKAQIKGIHMAQYL